MYLVLCSSSDASGLWVYEGLKQLGVAPMELVLSEGLAYGCQWEHRLDSSSTHLKITLPNGRAICSSRIRGAINRMIAPAPEATLQAAASDREYAQAELQAFYLSWLHGLPGRVINRPTAVGLSGAWFHASEWASRASRAGLAVRPYRQSSREDLHDAYCAPAPEGVNRLRLITFSGRVFGGHVTPSISRACARLAVEAGAEMLGIDLYAGENGEWVFAGATPHPDLFAGGAPLLKSLAQELIRGERP